VPDDVQPHPTPKPEPIPQEDKEPVERDDGWTQVRRQLPATVFAALVEMWTTVLVRDYLARHAINAVDTSPAPLYNGSAPTGGGKDDEDGPASGEAKAAHQPKDDRHNSDLDGAPAQPARAGHDHGISSELVDGTTGARRCGRVARPPRGGVA